MPQVTTSRCCSSPNTYLLRRSKSGRRKARLWCAVPTAPVLLQGPYTASYLNARRWWAINRWRAATIERF